MLRIWAETNSFVEVTCEICGESEAIQYSNTDFSNFDDVDFLDEEKDSFECDFDNFVILPNNLIICKDCYQKHILSLINEKKRGF